MLARAQKYCDYQDRYQQQVRDKLYSWGAKPDDVEQIICLLIEQGYIDEERYARSFARGKFRIKHWGRNRIRMELKFRKISEYCIKQGLFEIPDDDYIEILKQTIEKKMQDLHVSDKKKLNYLQQQKIVTHAVYRGFEADLIWKELKNSD